MQFIVRRLTGPARIAVVVRVGQQVWVEYFDAQDWAEATVLEIGETQALVRQLGTDRSDWVSLAKVFDLRS